MDTKTKLKIARGAVNLAVASSVSAVVKNVIDGNVVAENKIQKIQLTVGTIVISGMLVRHAKERTSLKFDEFAELIFLTDLSDQEDTAE